MQTCMVCGPPPNGELAPAGICMPAGNGDCCHVMVDVISYSPGFLSACAIKSMALATRVQPTGTQKEFLRIDPPSIRASECPRGTTLRNFAPQGKRILPLGRIHI